MFTCVGVTRWTGKEKDNVMYSGGTRRVIGPARGLTGKPAL